MTGAPLPAWGRGWLDGYRAAAGPSDLVQAAHRAGDLWWHHLFDGIATLTRGRLQRLEDRVARGAGAIGWAPRSPADPAARAGAIAAVPLLVGEREWAGIGAGVIQRAALCEALLADIYGPAALVAGGRLPATAITGSRHFWRPMQGMAPAGGYRLHIVGMDLARGPDGGWRVLGQQLRAPAGAGHAVEIRQALAQAIGPLQARLNVRGHAPFLSAFRDGLAAACRRETPRIGLLTPGRHAPNHAEQAHLARALGLLLVEGDDLVVRGGRLFLRTIQGLKRMDALWRCLDARWLDPLAFDARSMLGVPGLLDVVATGDAVLANMPGAGVLESRAIASLLPGLCEALLGEPLRLPGPDMIWGGTAEGAAALAAEPDPSRLRPAFADPVAGLDTGNEPAALRRALALRPQDYVAEAPVPLATAPMLAGGRLVPRPFTVRVFAARDGAGRWVMLPGGLARIGSDVAEGANDAGLVADLCVVGDAPAAPAIAATATLAVAIRRNPGTLPSRAADNFFWLGRYLERGEAILRLVRATLGGVVDAGLTAATLDALATLLIASGAAEDEADEEGAIRDLAELAAAALDGAGPSSLRTLRRTLRLLAEDVGDRLPAEMARLLEQPEAADPGDVDALTQRFAALAGLAAEAMDQGAGWRFLDLGRRIERGLFTVGAVRAFAGDAATVDDLGTLLDLCGSRGGYAARYLAGLALVPVRDLVLLDRFSPRSLAFQATRIAEHLAAMPRLSDDGVDEEPLRMAHELVLVVATMRAEAVAPATLRDLDDRLAALSDAIGRRFFLQGSAIVRAGGLVLA